jgi:hypothetical protein
MSWISRFCALFQRRNLPTPCRESPGRQVQIIAADGNHIPRDAWMDPAYGSAADTLP